MLKAEKRSKTKHKRVRTYPMSGRGVFDLLRLIREKALKMSNGIDKKLKSIPAESFMKILNKRDNSLL